MGPEKFRGFVLQWTDLSASRVLLTLFTREGGKRKGVLRLTKQRERAYLSPLTSVDLVLSGKEHQELKRISECSLHRQTFGLASDYLGLSLLTHWAFLIQHSQPADHEDLRVFRLLDHVLLDFENNPSADTYPVRNLFFEIWLLHFCGVLSRSGNPFSSDENQNPQQKSSPHPAMALIFHSRIERVAADALKWGSLTGTMEDIGQRWEQFLGKKLNPRTQLFQLFRQRRLL